MYVFTCGNPRLCQGFLDLSPLYLWRQLSLNPELTHSSKSSSLPWGSLRASQVLGVPSAITAAQLLQPPRSGTQALVFTPQALYLPSHYPQSFLKEFHSANILVTVSFKSQVPCWLSLDVFRTQIPTVQRSASEQRKCPPPLFCSPGARHLPLSCDLFQLEGPLDRDYAFTIFMPAQYIFVSSVKEGGRHTLSRGPEQTS